MNDLNHVQVVGYLARDPEIRSTPQGTAVGTVTVVTIRNWYDANNEEQSSLSFHAVVVWRRLAEICQSYLKKGSMVYFDGRLETRNWEDQGGNKKYKTEIVANNMFLLDPKNGQAPNPSTVNNTVNRAVVIGNLARDLELREANGSSVTNMTVITNYSWKTKEGEKLEKVEFNNIVLWGEEAKRMSETIGKGSKVYVEWPVINRSWEGQDGVKRYTTEIMADKIIPLGMEPTSQIKDLLGKIVDNKHIDTQEKSSDVGDVDINDVPF